MNESNPGTARDFGNMLNEKAVKIKKQKKFSPWVKMIKKDC